MISAGLLDEILAVCPTWDGKHRPPLPQNEPRRPQRHDNGAARLRAVERSRVAEDPAEALRRIVAEMPGCSALDVSVALHKRRGWTTLHREFDPRAIARILEGLARVGRIRAVRMTSRRDVARVGAAVLWEAA